MLVKERVVLKITSRNIKQAVAPRINQYHNTGDPILVVKYKYLNGSQINPDLMLNVTHIRIKGSDELIEIKSHYKGPNSWVLVPRDKSLNILKWNS